MFDYYDSSSCSFDIWSPKPDKWGDNAIENRAFSAYCYHQQKCDDIVQRVLCGETSFDIGDDLTNDDLDYIKNQLAEYGISANFTS